ncbi:MAG: sortase [Chloroflexi bacterium]|nr:sortase [Chloroflexota bacterium]
MRQPGDGSRIRSQRLVALVVALVSIPFIVGATAPHALRALLPPAIPAVEDPRLPPAEEGTVNAPQDEAGVLRLPAERLDIRVASHAPRTVPEQRVQVADLPPARGERAVPAPALQPHDPGWVARRLEIPALGVDVPVTMAGNAGHEDFPPFDGAYILRSSAQPGRGTNSYLFAHAMPNLFKPLWVAQVGQQVIVTMSDGQQLGYRVTAIVRDIPCPDPTVHKPAGLPPVLANATQCDLQWTMPTASERLTMQTSQGFNRNYGEMVVIAEPDW